MKKVCNRCGIEKTLDDFERKGEYYRGVCRSCRNQRRKERRLQIENINEKHKENRLKKSKEHYKNNKEYYDIKHKENYLKNREDYYNRKKTRIDNKIESFKKEFNSEGNIYGIIYLVHNKNTNRYYVGQTTKGFDVRYLNGFFNYHKDNIILMEDFKLHGEESFEFIKVFKIAHNRYELDKLEAYYIKYFNSYYEGYNRNRGCYNTKRSV